MFGVTSPDTDTNCRAEHITLQSELQIKEMTDFVLFVFSFFSLLRGYEALCYSYNECLVYIVKDVGV